MTGLKPTYITKKGYPLELYHILKILLILQARDGYWSSRVPDQVPNFWLTSLVVFFCSKFRNLKEIKQATLWLKNEIKKIVHKQGELSPLDISGLALSSISLSDDYDIKNLSEEIYDVYKDNFKKNVAWFKNVTITSLVLRSIITLSPRKDYSLIEDGCKWFVNSLKTDETWLRRPQDAYMIFQCLRDLLEGGIVRNMDINITEYVLKFCNIFLTNKDKLVGLPLQERIFSLLCIKSMESYIGGHEEYLKTADNILYKTIASDGKIYCDKIFEHFIEFISKYKLQEERILEETEHKGNLLIEIPIRTIDIYLDVYTLALLVGAYSLYNENIAYHMTLKEFEDLKNKSLPSVKYFALCAIFVCAMSLFLMIISYLPINAIYKRLIFLTMLTPTLSSFGIILYSFFANKVSDVEMKNIVLDRLLLYILVWILVPIITFLTAPHFIT